MRRRLLTVGTLAVGMAAALAAQGAREYSWAAANPGEQLYEYACHEGNYAMEGIMKGARLLEAEAAEAAKQAGTKQ